MHGLFYSSYLFSSTHYSVCMRPKLLSSTCRQTFAFPHLHTTQSPCPATGLLARSVFSSSTMVQDSLGSTLGAEQPTAVPHAARAWEWFNSLGAPKFHVAPMVDQSELPFRMLCRRYGATCAYTPMLHARLYTESEKYREEHFTTCPGDRPLLVQFCANDPDILLKAARLVEGSCDAVDLNFGCPQRIAKRGYYGATLMDDLPLVERLVKILAQNLKVPVTCKIRVFPDTDKTLAYARMIEAAGCSLLAVHGRTRDQKDNTTKRADWDAIKAVKAAVSIPVLANGNIRNIHDAYRCMEYTGCDGVLSAESLLEDPRLFAPSRALPGGHHTWAEAPQILREYLQLNQPHPTNMRMVKGHIHKILGQWLSEYTDLRDLVNGNYMTLDKYMVVADELEKRIKESGRDTPQPKISARVLARMQAEAMRQAAIDEQLREAAALDSLAPRKRAADDSTQAERQAQQGPPAPGGGSGVQSSSASGASYSSQAHPDNPHHSIKGPRVSDNQTAGSVSTSASALASAREAVQSQVHRHQHAGAQADVACPPGVGLTGSFTNCAHPAAGQGGPASLRSHPLKDEPEVPGSCAAADSSTVGPVAWQYDEQRLQQLAASDGCLECVGA